jgi:hypothetical protein
MGLIPKYRACPRRIANPASVSPDATRRGGQYFLDGQKVLKNPPGAPDAIAASCLAPTAFCAYAPGPPCAEKPTAKGKEMIKIKLGTSAGVAITAFANLDARRKFQGRMGSGGHGRVRRRSSAFSRVHGSWPPAHFLGTLLCAQKSTARRGERQSGRDPGESESKSGADRRRRGLGFFYSMRKSINPANPGKSLTRGAI